MPTVKASETTIPTVKTALTNYSSLTLTMESDPCGPKNIAAEVEKVHRFMREFDDASLLGSNTPRDLLNPSIADLQRIRRDAEDQPVPTCLTTLKQYQLVHMKTVINTMIKMLSYSGTDADTKELNQGIALAQQQHDQYVLELAKILGITVTVAPIDNIILETPATVTTPIQ